MGGEQRRTLQRDAAFVTDRLAELGVDAEGLEAAAQVQRTANVTKYVSPDADSVAAAGVYPNELLSFIASWWMLRVVMVH